MVLFGSVFPLELECSRSDSDLLVSAHGLAFVDSINQHQQTSSFQLQAPLVLPLATQ